MSREEYLNIVNNRSVLEVIKSLEIIYCQKLSGENVIRIYEYISNGIIEADDLYDKDRYGNDIVMAVATKIADGIELI